MAEAAHTHPFDTDNLYAAEAGTQEIYGLTAKNANRNDAIIRSATQSFCAPRRRSPNEITSYAKLVRPLLPKAEKKTLRWVSAALAKCDFAPSDICRLLANQSIAIAAPILAIASKLSAEDQFSIAQAKTKEHRVLLAQRSVLDSRVIDAILAHGEADPARNLLRKKPQGFNKEQTGQAVAIVAKAMDEHFEAEMAAKKLAKSTAANSQETNTVLSPFSQTVSKTISEPDENLAPNDLLARRIEQFAQIKDEISSRTLALEKARNQLVGMARTSQTYSQTRLSDKRYNSRALNNAQSSQPPENTASKINSESEQQLASSVTPALRPSKKTLMQAREQLELQKAQKTSANSSASASSQSPSASSTGHQSAQTGQTTQTQNVLRAKVQSKAKVETPRPSKTLAVTSKPVAKKTANTMPANSGNVTKEASTTVHGRLTQAIARLDEVAFRLEVETLLGLSAQKVVELTNESSLQTLSVALKAVSCPTLMARQILTASHMFSRRDVNRINNLLRAYEVMDADACRLALKMWQKKHPKQERIFVSGTLKGQNSSQDARNTARGAQASSSKAGVRPSRGFQVQATVR